MGKVIKLKESTLRQIIKNIISERKRHTYNEESSSGTKRMPEGNIEIIKRKINSLGSRDTAKWFLDIVLKKEFAGLSSDDLPDTSEFADALDEIEESFNENDFNNALTIALDYASNVKYDMGFGDEDEDDMYEEKCESCGGESTEQKQECPECGNIMEGPKCSCGHLMEELG